ncbi:hypothetical protein ACXZ1K_11400 [Pedobacter sp. PWIIR3]
MGILVDVITFPEIFAKKNVTPRKLRINNQIYSWYDKMKHAFLITAVVSILQGCNLYKKDFYSLGGRDEAISNAISDFLKTERQLNKDSVYDVSYSSGVEQKIEIRRSDGIYQDSILGVDSTRIKVVFFALHKPVVFTSTLGSNNAHILDYSKYIEKGGKLFIFRDKQPVTESTLAVFRRFNIVSDIDSLYLLADHDQKAVFYYFCKKDLRIFKKVKGAYERKYEFKPQLNCPKN